MTQKTCFHCGLDATNSGITFDNKSFCCNGCKTVYEILHLTIKATGVITKGGIYMTLFGLGTIPLMTSAIYFSNFLKVKTRQRIQNIIPAFVVIIGVLFIIRGLGLGIPYLSPSPIQEVVINNIDCH